MTPDQVSHITLWRCPDCPVLIPSMAGRLPSVDVHEEEHAAERRHNNEGEGQRENPRSGLNATTR